MVWLRTCLHRCVHLAIAFTPQLAATPLKAAPTATQSKAAAVAASANVDTTKDASSSFDLSAFSQIVTQIVEESAAPVQAPGAQAVKLPPKPAAAQEEPLPELSSPAQAAPAKPTETVAGRKQDSRSPVASTNERAAQPPPAAVDINVPVPVAPKLRVPSFTGGGSGEENLMKPAAVSGSEEPAATILQPKPLLEVKIHLDQPATAPSAQNEEVTPQGPEDTDPGPRRALRTTDVQQAPAGPVVSVNIPQQTPELPVQNSTPLPVSSVPVPPPVYTGEAKPEPQAASAPPREEPVADQTKTQPPIRSLALEFTPDGAADIKVRLSERSGDVHISLHGTDPSLAGRVREEVSDLVGSLAKAGYDAEAWTPGEGRQGQRQQSDQRQSLRKPATEANAAEFNRILQQPIQEIS
jgi:hypothetical protein